MDVWEKLENIQRNNSLFIKYKMPSVKLTMEMYTGVANIFKIGSIMIICFLWC